MRERSHAATASQDGRQVANATLESVVVTIVGGRDRRRQWTQCYAILLEQHSAIASARSPPDQALSTPLALIA